MSTGIEPFKILKKQLRDEPDPQNSNDQANPTAAHQHGFNPTNQQSGEDSSDGLSVAYKRRLAATLNDVRISIARQAGEITTPHSFVTHLTLIT